MVSILTSPASHLDIFWQFMVAATPVADAYFNPIASKNNGNEMLLNMLRNTQEHQWSAAC
jgi:hypothetical protein